MFALGAIVADEVFALSMPVLVLDEQTFAQAAGAAYARVAIEGRVQLAAIRKS